VIKTHFINREQSRTKQGNCTIQFGIHSTPIGRCLIILSGRRVAALGFVKKGFNAEGVREFIRDWKNPRVLESSEMTRPVVERIFSSQTNSDQSDVELSVPGTSFQIKVWTELLRIPYGSVVSYQEVAERIGMPRAARAVGNAIGQNRIAYLIPCHRVIRKSGELGKYRWGEDQKRKLLEMESRSLISSFVY
jgi:AraC family transcriptional regulator of adaptative response/methylated-DNA-[protein]-cysteine methyltransferase